MREPEGYSPETNSNPGLAEAQRALKTFLQGNVFFHYTLMRVANEESQALGVDKLASGLYPTRKSAETARRKLTEKPEAPFTTEDWEESEVVHLNVGEPYHPWGEGGRVKTHGVNDGTHPRWKGKPRE